MLSLKLVSRTATRSTRAAQRCYAAAALPQYLLNLPQVTETRLDNGFRVASETSGGETSSIGIFIDAGSAFETSANNGTAHFLEHMSFKGTNKRSRVDIEKSIENMGAQLNAYTSREQTVYHAQCLNKDSSEIVDILGDMVLNSRLEPDLIECERSTILQEKESIEENAEEVLFDYLHAAAFQGSPLARTILGTTKNIETLSQTDLRHYIDSHYQPSRMALVSSGGISHDQLVAAANEVFGAMPKGSPAPPRHMPPFTGSEIRLRDDALGKAHVAVAFESVGYSSPDYFTFQVLMAMLGEWSSVSPVGTNGSTRLAELVGTEGIAHSFNAFHCCYNEIGLFGISFVAPQESTDDMMCESLGEIVRIANHSVESEVERAKNAVKSQLLLGVDNTSTSLDEIGRQLIALGRHLPPAEAWARIDAITPADVQKVATHYCTDTDFALAAIGNTHNLPEYNQLRNWTYANRY